MTFSHPWVVALWLIPVFLLLWEAFRKSPTVALPFDHQEHRRRPWLRRSLWLAATLPPAILVITIGVVAGPQVMGEPQKRREVTNIEICLDVSGSMGVMMSDGTLRNDAAVAAIQNFCEARRGDACGLTIFGGETIRWTPLTLDLDAIALAAPFIDPRKMPPHMLSTRIGGALRSCMGSLSEQEEGDRMVVLVSDGFSSDLSGGAARQVGQELAALDIALYAIFIGDGSAPGQLYEVVAQTQGEVFAAHDSEALQRVFDHIDSMKPAKLKPAGARPIEDFSLLAWCGLALLALHLLASLGLRVTPW